MMQLVVDSVWFEVSMFYFSTRGFYLFLSLPCLRCISPTLILTVLYARVMQLIALIVRFIVFSCASHVKIASRSC